jgi:preprotein translocase subunit SecF
MFRNARAVIFVAALALVFPLAALAQTSGKDMAKKTEDAVEAIRGYTVEKKNEAVAHGKKVLRDIDGQLKRMDAQTAKATGEVKVAAQQQMQELKAKRKDVAAKLDEMGKATAASWDTVKNGFADAVKDLHGAYDKAVAQFKK